MTELELQTAASVILKNSVIPSPSDEHKEPTDPASRRTPEIPAAPSQRDYPVSVTIDAPGPR